MEMDLPVVVDQSLGGGFSYYPACRQRCIQCCHYSILIYYRPNFGARPGQAILGSPKKGQTRVFKEVLLYGGHWVEV